MINQTRQEQTQNILGRVDDIKSQQQTFKLTQMLIDDRKQRSGSDLSGNKSSEIAKQFANINNTFNILSKTMGDYGDVSRTELDSLNSLVEITQTAEFASAKEQKDLLRQVDTQIRILQEVEGHTDPSESPILAEALKTQKMLKENSGGLDRFNDFVGNQFIGGMGALVGVLGNSPLLAMGAQFIGNKFQERKERKSDQNKQLQEAAAAKVDRELDVLIQAVPAKDLTPEIDQEDMFNSLRDGMQAELQDAITAETNPELKEELELIFEALAGRDGVVEAINKVEKETHESIAPLAVAMGLMTQALESGNVDAINRAKTARRDAEEARRDKMKKGFVSTSGVDDNDLGDLEESISDKLKTKFSDMFTFTGLGVGAAMSKIWKTFSTSMIGKFSVKAISFILKKAFPIAMIATGLFQGFKAATDEYKKSGDIYAATSTFFGQLAETLTFGLLTKEQLSKWGSQLGLWVEDHISAVFGQYVEILTFGLLNNERLSKSIDSIKRLAASIVDWFSWIGNIDIRDLLPNSMVKLMEKYNFIDTVSERKDSALAEEYDKQQQEKDRIDAKNAKEDDSIVDALAKGREINLQHEASARNISVVQLKAEKQRQEMARPMDYGIIPPTKIQAPEMKPAPLAIPMTQSPVLMDGMSNISPVVESKNGNAETQLSQLQKIETAKTVIEERKVRRIEEEKRKDQQPRGMVQQNFSSKNNNAIHITPGGPSDDDVMFNRFENATRVG